MFALISDIHGNLEALDAVLADIAARGVSTIFCLGDLVGYGPDPVECIDRATKWSMVLLGNHDLAVTTPMEGFSKQAQRVLDWTRQQIAAAQRPDLTAFLASRPQSHRTGNFLFVHASPRYPTTEYLFPEDARNAQKMAKNAELIDRYCFTGHTHVPGVFVEPYGAGGHWQFLAPEEIDSVWKLNKRKTIVNIGAVGQPRDKNWRACYVLVDGDDVTFRRVEYDIDTTVSKIRAIPELSNSLADRLREGT
jgi:diadenosine tetraphosphatase ApaH/serine/threonine PP2A family protein phosphatase